MLAATLLFFLATKPELVIIARGIQGASTALVWVSGIAFMVAQVEESNIGRFMGYLIMGTTLGELAGPVLGGLLYDTLGHWAVLGVVEALIAVDIGLRLLVRESGSEKGLGASVSAHEASETDSLLGNGEQTSNNDSSFEQNGAEDNYGLVNDLEINGHADPIDSDNTVALQALGWNWCGTVVALAVAVTIRCGLEAVSIPFFIPASD